ncbi:hypothetical protein [Cellulosimicrobium sp. SL-1]|uniref:hypothetical protein n=1 Tax=Cellulosimicrobium sp. SL-1 TaxID=2699423 RepID=UPI0013D06537|nr:hypothetical protein [Cellulosimicrobium sp. SL-1]
MAKDLRLGIVVDTDTRATKQEFSSLRREVKREADAMGGDWEAAAQKVEDALREAGARNDLIDAAQRIGREGPSEIEKMQRALKDTGDTARSLSDDIRDAADDIKRSFDDSSLSANDIFDANFKAEIQASARETGSEILGQISGALSDGSMDMDTLVTSISDGLVEIGAEVGGPAGGAMVAGGLIASALWGQITAQKEAVQEDISAMFDNIIEQGAAAAEAIRIGENIRDLTENQDKLNFSTKMAKELNTDLSTVIRARAGDEAAMSDVLAAQTQRQEELKAEYENGTISLTVYEQESRKLGDAVQDITNDFDSERSGIDAAKLATDAYREATEATNAAIVSNAQALAMGTGKAQEFTVTVDGATRTLKAMPNGKVIDVTDGGSVELTQSEINNIKGGSVKVGVWVSRDEMQSAVNAAAQNVVSPYVQVRPYVSTRV